MHLPNDGPLMVSAFDASAPVLSLGDPPRYTRWFSLTYKDWLYSTPVHETTAFSDVLLNAAHSLERHMKRRANADSQAVAPVRNPMDPEIKLVVIRAAADAVLHAAANGERGEQLKKLASDVVDALVAADKKAP